MWHPSVRLVSGAARAACTSLSGSGRVSVGFLGSIVGGMKFGINSCVLGLANLGLVKGGSPLRDM